MLRSAGTDIKVQQELVRHANIQTAMNVYTQAVSDQKRAANSKVVEMVLASAKTGPKCLFQRMGAERERIGSLQTSHDQLQGIDVVELEVGCGGWI
jgi:hypothetical protein